MANQIKWSIDKPHSEISFIVKHLMMLPDKGAFQTFDASTIQVIKRLQMRK